MIVKFEEPRLIKIKDIIESLKEGKHYIERFQYGDYDNWVNAIIINLEVHNSTFYPNTIYGPKYDVCLYNTFKHSLEDERTYTACPSYLEDKPEDIYDRKIEVIGYAMEEQNEIKNK